MIRYRLLVLGLESYSSWRDRNLSVATSIRRVAKPQVPGAGGPAGAGSTGDIRRRKPNGRVPHSVLRTHVSAGVVLVARQAMGRVNGAYTQCRRQGNPSVTGSQGKMSVR